MIDFDVSFIFKIIHCLLFILLFNFLFSILPSQIKNKKLKNIKSILNYLMKN